MLWWTHWHPQGSNRGKVKSEREEVITKGVVYQGRGVDLATVAGLTVSSSTILLFMESAMIAFEVNDMTCGHCVSTITKAVKAADEHAQVQIDLNKHLVQIAPGELDAEELGDAIKEAGYTPVPVPPTSSDRAPAKQGSCCGCS